MTFESLSTMSNAAGYKVYYASLVKPFFAPPDWLFGVAWGIIYPLIAIAFVLALYQYFKNILPGSFIGMFAINIIANISFTPIQLGLRDNVFASADILLVLFSLVYLELEAHKRSKGIFVLLLPYLLWGSFATALLLSITVLNW